MNQALYAHMNNKRKMKKKKEVIIIIKKYKKAEHSITAPERSKEKITTVFHSISPF
jgi:hypothetical protein